MSKSIKTLVALFSAACLAASVSACTDATYDGYISDGYSYEDATEELEVKLGKINVNELPAKLDIYDVDAPSQTLADIDTFELTVQGNTPLNIEIAAPSELSGAAPDDLINVLAKNFNNERIAINNQTASVSIRKIASGEVVTYMTEGDYRPDAYIPSSYALGEMLRAKGIGVVKLADRIAGNTAGILMKSDIHDSFIAKYGDATVDKVLEASLAGDLTFAYTNPYTSATGLNILTAMLHSFDPDNPLSSEASEKLLDYQRQSPPVAYTTGVLRTQAAKGIIKAMVMEEQAYTNTPELKDYIYIPAGIRHDHPVYTFDYVSPDKQDVARRFVEYCLSSEAQHLADRKGFNLHDDYVGQDSGLDGSGYLAAQKIWKANKDGGQPIIAVFVADVSVSMDGRPLSALKESLLATSQYIGSDNYIGLISYSDDVYINLPIAQFDETQRAYFSGGVKNLSPIGSTATYDGVLVGLQLIHEKSLEMPDAKRMLFVLSDGQANRGFSLNNIKNIVDGMHIPIYTIGYNLDDDSSAANQLSELSTINEATLINAHSDDIVNQLRNLFNVQL